MTGVEHPGSSWPIAFADVLAAEGRIRECVPEPPLRRYAPLDADVGGGIGVWVKHENHAPTNSFKIRNALSVMTRLSEEERIRTASAISASVTVRKSARPSLRAPNAVGPAGSARREMRRHRDFRG
jgi:hypothetical protein